jgi:pentapeptide MXKDX repeat protein
VWGDARERRFTAEHAEVAEKIKKKRFFSAVSACSAVAVDRLAIPTDSNNAAIVAGRQKKSAPFEFSESVTSSCPTHPYHGARHARRKNSGGSMKKPIGKLMLMCVLALSLNAFAQTTETNQDSMKHDDMKQDTMKHDDMKHDDMKQDTMKHDDMKKDDMAKGKKAKKLKKDKMKKDDMKADDMKKDDMKKDDMSKDEMKKN